MQELTKMKNDSITLNGKQVRQLRAIAHNLDPALQIGKNGITDAVVRQAHDSLEAHEIIKCATQSNSPLATMDTGCELAERLKASLVQVIGHRFVLYRPTSREDVKKIELVD